MLEHNPRHNSLKEEKVIWLTILEIPGCDQTALLFPMWWSKPTNQGRRKGEEKTEVHNPLQGYFQDAKDPTRPYLPNVPHSPYGTTL